MVSYSAPITRDGRFAGVVTIDLALEFFQSLRESLDHLGLGRNTSCFLLTRQGAFLRHPDLAHQFPAPVSNFNQLGTEPSFRILASRFRQEEAGVGEARDIVTGQPAVYLFSRVPSTDWTLLIAIPATHGASKR